MLVAHGHGADANRSFVSCLVVQESDSLGGLRCFHGAGDGAIFVAEFTSWLIAMQHGFRDAAVAHDFVAQAARNALGSVAPEDNLLLQVDDAQAGG